MSIIKNLIEAAASRNDAGYEELLNQALNQAEAEVRARIGALPDDLTPAAFEAVCESIDLAKAEVIDARHAFAPYKLPFARGLGALLKLNDGVVDRVMQVNVSRDDARTLIAA